jgi:hypothetical protein
MFAQGARKDTLWDHTGKNTRPETTEVSTATPSSLPGCRCAPVCCAAWSHASRGGRRDRPVGDAGVRGQVHALGRTAHGRSATQRAWGAPLVCGRSVGRRSSGCALAGTLQGQEASGGGSRTRTRAPGPTHASRLTHRSRGDRVSGWGCFDDGDV